MLFTIAQGAFRKQVFSTRRGERIIHSHVYRQWRD